MRDGFARVRFRRGPPLPQPRPVPESAPLQPEWGRMIQAAREDRGWSIRHAALRADMSDVYWAQMENGYAKRHGKHQPVKPSLGKLLQAATALRMTSADTDKLITSAGYKSLPRQRLGPDPVRRGISTDGLTEDQERQLEALADFMRRQNPEADQ